MEIKTVSITPAIARKWLEVNTINRPLRRTVVDGYLMAYKRGEHRLTHQGIAFSDSGELLDGQHRLTAISEMPEAFSLEMAVARNVPKSSFDSIDIGLKRSSSDVLRVSPGMAGVARYMATIIETSRCGITPQSLMPYIHGIESTYANLVGFCPKRTKVWSCASIQTAAILRMLNGGDKDYIRLSYYALNHAEFDSMSPIVQALFRQHVRGLTSGKGYDIFCRAYKAFDFRSQGMDKLQISDSTAVVGTARAIIQTRVLAEKKGATVAAPKKVNAGNSTALARA